MESNNLNSTLEEETMLTPDQLRELLNANSLNGAMYELSPLGEEIPTAPRRNNLQVLREASVVENRGCVRNVPASKIIESEILARKVHRIYSQTNPIASARLLDDVRRLLKRFVVLKSEHHFVALTLWIVHTHAIEYFDFTPRLGIWSPEKRCGKSLLLEVVSYLTPHPIRTSDISPAALFRVVARDIPPTVFIDETDAIFGGKGNPEKAEALRSITNAGFKRGQVVIRCVPPKYDEAEFPVFAAVALAGIGTSAIPETVADRAVMIEMRRKHSTEEIEEFESDEVSAIFDGTRDEIAAFIISRGGELRHLKVEKIPDPNARARDKWKPLLRIATLAGDEWLERARNAAIALDAGDGDIEEMSEKLRLLKDVHGVFKVPQLSSKDLVYLLMEDEESEWRYRIAFNQLILARMLNQYGIRTKTLSTGNHRGSRGYVLADFLDAWKRYLPELSNPETPATTATPATTREDQSHHQPNLDALASTVGNHKTPETLGDKL
jgi:hypothetical protein